MEIWGLLDGNNKSSFSFIDYPSSALAAIIDRLIVLEDGHCNAYGTTAELLQTANQYSKAYQHLVPLN